MSKPLHDSGPARHSPESPMCYTGTTHPELTGKTCRVRQIHQGGFLAGRFLWARFDDPTTAYAADWHLFEAKDFSAPA